MIVVRACQCRCGCQAAVTDEQTCRACDAGDCLWPADPIRRGLLNGVLFGFLALIAYPLFRFGMAALGVRGL